MSIDPITVWSGFKFWTKHKPFKKWKAWRAKRKGKGMVIDNGRRTTTNMTASGLVVWGVLKAVSHFFPEFPTDGLEELLAAVTAYVVGYLTKTPAQPKAL